MKVGRGRLFSEVAIPAFMLNVDDKEPTMEVYYHDLSFGGVPTPVGKGKGRASVKERFGVNRDEAARGSRPLPETLEAARQAKEEAWRRLARRLLPNTALPAAF